MKYTLLFLAAILYSFSLFAQSSSPQDCVGAVTICSADTVTAFDMEGAGNIEDLAVGSTCFNSQESNSVWLELNIDQTGWLVFSITPIGPQDDYDFILFKADSNDCTDIWSRSVRCNFAGTPGMATGLKVGVSDTSVGVSGGAWLAPINVTTGEKYYLLVDSYTSAGVGFDFTTNGSTSSLAANATSAEIATLVYDSTANTLLVELTEAVNTTSVSIDDSEFKVTGPNGSVAINDVSSDTLLIKNGDVYSRSFLVSFSDSFTNSGYYLLELVQGTDNDILLGDCSQAMPYDSSSFLVLIESPNDSIPDDTLSVSPAAAHFSDQVQVFPNPTKDVLYISTDLPEGTAWSATLFDLSGKQISAAEVATQSHQFSLSALPNGTYLLVCNSAFGSYQQKVVVLH